MSRRSPLLLALVALALLGGGAYVLLSGGNSGVSADFGGRTAPEAATPLVAATTDDVKAISTSAFQDRDDGPQSPLAGLAVLVVDETDNPLPGASVEIHRADRGRGGPQDFFNTARKPLRTMTADAEGRIPLDQLPRRTLELIGRAPKRVGTLSLDPAEAEDHVVTPWKLTLKSVKTVEVTVLDTSGSPLPGVRVQATDRNAFGGFGGSRETAWTSDPEGRTTFEITVLDGAIYESDKAEVAATLPGTPRIEGEAGFVDGAAKLVLTAPQAVYVRIKAKPAKGESLPPEMRLDWAIDGTRDAQGGGDPGAFFRASPFGSRDFTGPTVAVGGFKPGVEVKFTLSADSHLASDKVVTLPATGNRFDVEIDVGPAQPFVAMKLVDELGRAITDGEYSYDIVQDGETPAGAGAEQGGRGGRGGRGGMGRMNAAQFRRRDLTPDAAGVVRVPVKPSAAGKVTLEEARTGRMRMFGGRDDSAPLAEREFQAPTPGETLKVADVVIPRKPVLAAGRVLDAGGKPVRRATVALAGSGRTQGGRGGAGGGGQPIGGGGPGGGFDARFFALFEAEAVTDAEGKFELRADYAGLDLAGTTLTAATRRSRSTPATFAAGDTNVEIRVIGYGGIKGSIKVISPDLKGDVTIRARPVGEEPNQGGGFGGFGGGGRGGRTTARVDAKTGNFELKELLPGRYDVSVRYDDAEALSIVGIEVTSGETNADPRLQNVALGGQFLLAAVLVLDADGAPLAGANVNFIAQGGSQAGGGGGGGRGGGQGGGRGGSRTDASGRLVRVFPQPPETVTVVVTARDYAQSTIANAAFPLSVRMSRGATLTVAFDLAGGLPAIEGVDGWRVRARASSTAAPAEAPAAAGGRTGRDGQGGGNAPGGAGQGGGQGGGRGGRQGGRDVSARVETGGSEAKLKAMTPGDYDLRLEPILGTGVRGDGSMDFMTMFGGGAGLEVGRVAIKDGDVSPRFVVTLDAALLAKLKELAVPR